MASPNLATILAAYQQAQAQHEGTPSPSPEQMAPPPQAPIPGQPPIPMRDPFLNQPSAAAPQPQKGGGLSHLLKYALPALGTIGLGAIAHKKGALGEALGGFAKGFGEGKLEQWKTTADQKHAENKRNVDMAHKVVMEDLDGLSDETLKRYPKLQQLAQSYREKLANDNMISPKEAAELIVEHTAARGELEKARSTEKEESTIGQFERGVSSERQGQMGPFQTSPREEASRQYYQMTSPGEFNGEAMPRTEAIRLKIEQMQREAADKKAQAVATQAASLESGRESRFQRSQDRLATQFNQSQERLAKAAEQKPLPQADRQTIEGLDTGRATMESLMKIIKAAKLQNTNEPIGPKFEKKLYEIGIDPGEIDRQVNQLSGLGMASMLGGFSGRFRNREYMNILTGHMPKGGTSYQMLYNMSKDLLPLIKYKRSNIYRLNKQDETPYVSPDFEMSPPPQGVGAGTASKNPYR